MNVAKQKEKKMNKDKLWKLSFYKDMDLTRIYIMDAIEMIEIEKYEKAKRKLDFVKKHLNSFLKDYDQFTYEERLKSLD